MRYVLLTLLLLFNLQAKSFFSNSEQEDSSAYIGGLKNLIISAQKTRGLTNSYLNGNTAAMLLVFGNRSDMKKAMETMKSLKLSSDPIINAQAQPIFTAFKTLNKKAFKSKDSDEVFSTYTQLIQDTLVLAQTVSQRASKEMSPLAKESSLIMMNIMLPMTEYVGQMRGFGAGLAAKKSANKEEREKMLALASKIQTLNQQLQEKMGKLITQHQDKFPAALKSQLIAVNTQSAEYISFVERHFTQEKIDVDPNSFFDQGTALITQIVKAYDSANYAISEDAKGWI